MTLYYGREILREACRTGDTTELASLINRGMFNVNESIYYNTGNMIPPLYTAIQRQSLPVATLLLDYRANPNTKQNWLLEEAISHGNLEMVRLLLARGADPNYDKGKNILKAAVATGQLDMVSLLLDRVSDFLRNIVPAIQDAIDYASHHESSEILEFLLDRAIYRLDADSDAEDAEEVKGLIQFSQLSLAILRKDPVQVAELLMSDGSDYESYAEVLEWEDCCQPCYQPLSLAFRLDRTQVLKDCQSIIGKVHKEIYFEAGRQGDLEFVNLCAASPEFDLFVCNESGRNLLHETLRYGQLKLAKILLTKYGFSLDMKDSRGRTPVFYINEPETLHGLLAVYPEIDVNAMDKFGENPLIDKLDECDIYVALLEVGADPEHGKGNYCNYHESSKSAENYCHIIQYLHKMSVIDFNYMSSIFEKIDAVSRNEFNQMKNNNKEEHELEMAKMQSIRISQSTTTIAGKSLLDFIYFSPNDAARYAKNEFVLQIYEENEQDFRKYLPHFGFILNRQLRRGKVRRQRLEAALEFLSETVGTGLPEHFAELIFGFFTNRQLENFQK